MPTIYRLENQAGIGPFRPDHGYVLEQARNPECYDFPTPFQEGLPCVFGLLCGTVSLQQLEEWFFKREETVAHLADCGYGIAKYYCKRSAVEKGRFQVVFEKAKARRISWKPLRAGPS